MRIAKASLQDWESIRRISSVSGYDDYIGKIGPSYLKDGTVLAVYDTELIAFMKLEFLGDRSVWLSGLRVDPSRRREGIATYLTKGGLEHARSKGCMVARMIISSTNTPSVNLAKRLGFQPILDYQFYEGAVDTSGFSLLEEVPRYPLFLVWKVMIPDSNMKVDGRYLVRGESRMFLTERGDTTYYHLLSGNDFSFTEGDSIIVVERGRFHLTNMKRLEGFEEGLVFQKFLI